MLRRRAVLRLRCVLRRRSVLRLRRNAVGRLRCMRIGHRLPLVDLPPPYRSSRQGRLLRIARVWEISGSAALSAYSSDS